MGQFRQWNGYSEQIIVQDSDVDWRGMMRPSALIRYAELFATRHSWAVGLTDDFYKEQQLVYLLAKQAFSFSRLPHRGEKLTIVTVPEQSRRAANKRLTFVEDEAGQEIALVDARWILVDTRENKIVRRPPAEIDNLWNKEVDCELPVCISKPEQLQSAGCIKAGYSVCDINGHINNACYLDIASDILPMDALKQGPFLSGSIKYHREVPWGEIMEVSYGQTEQGWYVEGLRESKSAFELSFQY